MKKKKKKLYIVGHYFLKKFEFRVDHERKNEIAKKKTKLHTHIKK